MPPDATLHGTLYLIPTPLGEGDLARILPAEVRQQVSLLERFIVEHPKTARHFLKQINPLRAIQTLKLEVLDEHTPAGEVEALLAPLLAGEDVGLLSEAGCPAIADPGGALVRMAHQKKIRVVPFVGPSSILLALMASGLNGQRFHFHGYLPVASDIRNKEIARLEQTSITADETQIFIETPYRNQKLLEALVQQCHTETDLCVACNLTQADEYVSTKSIGEWRAGNWPDLQKKPTVFLLHGQKQSRKF
ncbi:MULTISPECIES: SAM-dependent methyltransferase [Nitrosomonas]|uniref:Uroporphyrin-III C/tetrapyrrole (Corrin/Porphyrin) methyltransferase n=1 Tax=Nitrosomonas europaea (strain ATCC 19718 / CIP 103999 / KCTC 2705 / NBRC 14298) TaxID=228410 RepID=Q820L1_NITEU|nr:MULTISPECIES: SAM-dependent methyltransferase [Nitrosomonas]CAD85483.1 Uroporphyrin-III C/tetrapyrrole (Corrin/Porphyrin) methyltransferase [Nitrosomonas europaea ATCC 19718]SDW82673.1 16S rRNA (cytidine1402-2'-O)-methyltransferase [Nitrosomonas europaea]SET36671.1 16S rRNA (cytidine1402-2'-O)-methyltransferase [Nitrosomonas europaea]SJZ91665.1 16S rRNA (cytidine1402-2'-O)-methyltransferase [Nitrosomonas europaea]HBF25210.1 SAM-dependent methyltransferase [Nitrosomonas sp.]